MDHALVKGAECREHSRDMPSVNTINPRYIFHFMNEFAEALPVAVRHRPSISCRDQVMVFPEQSLPGVNEIGAVERTLCLCSSSRHHRHLLTQIRAHGQHSDIHRT